jgi:hypothetical protein
MGVVHMPVNNRKVSSIIFYENLDPYMVFHSVHIVSFRDHRF